MKSPILKLAEAIERPDVFSPNGCAHPVFIAGIKYPSLFDADLDSGIRAVSIWKAMKRSGGYPVQIRKALVVMESFVTERVSILKQEYEL